MRRVADAVFATSRKEPGLLPVSSRSGFQDLLIGIDSPVMQSAGSDPEEAIRKTKNADLQRLGSGELVNEHLTSFMEDL